MKARVLQVILIAIIDAYAVAAAAAPLSLQDCITQAIHHSPALSAARHDALSAREGVTEKLGSLMPFLSAQANAYEVNGAPATPFSALRVFDAGNPLAKILLVEQKVVFDTTTAYAYSVWYRSEAALASKILHLSEERLKIIRYQAQLQLKLPQDVELANAQLVAAQQAASSAMLNASDSVAALSALIGRPDSDITIDTLPIPTPPLPPLREFLARVIPAHPALRVQRGLIEIAQQQVRVDKAALYPSVKLNFGLAGAQNLEHFQGNTLSNFLSFIQVDIPIFDFGKRKAAVRASQQRAAAASDSLEAIDLELRNSIAQTYHQIVDADEKISSLQAYIMKANNAATLANAERREGLIDELTWAEAQLQVPAAEIALGQSELFTQLKYAELRNLSGGIWHWLDDVTPPVGAAAAQKIDKSATNPANVTRVSLADTHSDADRAQAGATGATDNDRTPKLQPVAAIGPAQP